MQKIIGNQIIGTCSIDFGRIKNHQEVRNNFVDIISINDMTKRNKEIDKFLDSISSDKNNGFLGSDQQISIGSIQKIMIDDREIYYNFFKNISEMYFSNKKCLSNNSIINAVVKTVNDYFGSTIINENKRYELTNIADNNFEARSIKELKNQHYALCVERASVAHNLLMLCGFDSHFVNNLKDEHAFTVVVSNDNKKSILIDIAQNRYKTLNFNMIEKMNSNEEIVLDNFKYYSKLDYSLFDEISVLKNDDKNEMIK